MANVTLTYNTGAQQYNFSPVPFINLRKNFQKTQDGSVVGALFEVTLDGTLVSVPTGGLVYIDNLQDRLRTYLAEEGKALELRCDGSLIFKAYPRINSISFSPSNNNWVFTSPYTIDMEWDEEPVGTGENTGVHPPFVSDASEEWSFEFLGERYKYSLNTSVGLDTNPYQFRLTHNVNAKGKRRYSESGLRKQAWEEAREFVLPRLGYDATKVQSSGLINLNAALYNYYNHTRTENIGELDGSYAVNESWIVINPTGSGIAGNALEDFSCSIKTSSEDGLTTVSVEGTVKGLETIQYGSNPGDFTVLEDKYTSALNYWNTIAGSLRIYPRAVAISGLTLNTVAKNNVISHNPPQGEINYSYDYDNRPSNCATGALSEVFVIGDENPHDIIAIVPIPGRSLGPILQDIGTVSERKRTLDIETVMAPQTGCPTSVAAVSMLINSSPKSQYDAIINTFEDQLEAGYSQVFRTLDRERWEPKAGRYSRNIEWTYQNCS